LLAFDATRAHPVEGEIEILEAETTQQLLGWSGTRICFESFSVRLLGVRQTFVESGVGAAAGACEQE
jgi:hypothetical protein